jgi:hypothetical protein
MIANIRDTKRDAGEGESRTYSNVKPKKNLLSWLSLTFILTNFIFFILLGWAIFEYGSMRNAIDRVRGHVLVVDSSTKSFGNLTVGSRVDLTYRLTNVGNDTVRILGSQVDCTCVVYDDRPFRLAPRESREFQVSIELVEKPGKVRRVVTLFTNIPNQPKLELSIIGAVVDSTTPVERQGTGALPRHPARYAG